MMLRQSVLLLSLTFALSIFVVTGTAYADVIPPLQQMELDFSAKEIVCKENLVKVIRTSNDNAVCVKTNSVDFLVEMGIIVSPDPEIVSKVMQQKSNVVGKITHMATTKASVKPGVVDTFSKVSVYNYVFKICSEDEKIKSPEVILSSDAETKSIKLVREIPADSCYTNAAKINALDPDTITSRLSNHGGVTEIIVELENKIEELKLDLVEQREKISTINPESPSTDRAKKISAIHKKITDIRNELKDTRAEKQKFLLFLSLSATHELSPIPKGKSITGVEVDDVLTDILSVHTALIQPDTLSEGISAYNVAFEICTDKNVLRIPVVELSSDIETKSVKMADKVPVNSCQMTTAKINAKDANSISVLLAGQSATSSTILELEKKINDLKGVMKIEQDSLNAISTSSSISKEEKQSSINESSTKIIELRNELNAAKVELHKILLQVYR